MKWKELAVNRMWLVTIKKWANMSFFGCSAESPKGCTSVCYDRERPESRKEYSPKNTAMNMAAAMGIELFTEEQYRELQQIGDISIRRRRVE